VIEEWNFSLLVWRHRRAHLLRHAHDRAPSGVWPPLMTLMPWQLPQTAATFPSWRRPRALLRPAWAKPIRPRLFF